MGMSNATIDSINSKEKMIKLWVHEFERVFKDRLNCLEDKLWFEENLG